MVISHARVLSPARQLCHNHADHDGHDDESKGHDDDSKGHDNDSLARISGFDTQ